MNATQKQAWYVMLFFIVMLIALNFLPVTWPFISQLNTLSVAGIITLIIIIISLFRDRKSGDAQYDVNALIRSSSQWNLIIMVGMCFLMIELMGSEEAGVIDTIVVYLTPSMNYLGVVKCIVIMALILGCFTQFLPNMVLGLIFIPIVSRVMVAIGGSPIASTLAISAALMTSFLTPAASTQSAMLFGMNADVKRRMLVGYAGLAVISGLFCTVCILLPLALIVF